MKLYYSVLLLAALFFKSTNAELRDERYLESDQSGYGGYYGGGGGGMMGGGNSSMGGMGMGGMGMGGMGMGGMGFGEEMFVIHSLLDNRGAIQREVTDELWGATTVTTSTDSQVTDWIRTHVEQMMTLVENNGRIRPFDPLFEAIFDNREYITLTPTPVDGGIEVKLLGSTTCAIALVQSHAAVINLFLTDGYDAMHELHDAPC